MTATTAARAGLDAFAAACGDTFAVVASDAAGTMTLQHATAMPQRAGAADAPFELVFRAPAEQRWPQGSYLFRHPTLGDHVIFVVPVGSDDAGLRYQAVFN